VLGRASLVLGLRSDRIGRIDARLAESLLLQISKTPA
jgi:hypothetical protein